MMSIVDELVERIMIAQEEMLKHEIEANTVVLNGKKYARLINGKNKPTICGLAVEVANLPNDMDFLVQYVEPVSKTKADRIRALTDEELACFITDAAYDFTERPGMCDVCYTPSMSHCRACWLEWLQQEVDDDENCKYYTESPKMIFTYDKYTGKCDGSYTIQQGRCMGTKELEEVNCHGKKDKCETR